MFIFAFILSVLNISQILSGTSSSINDQAIKSKFGDSIPDSYICNYKDLKYSEYMVPVPPVPPVPGDAGAPQPKDKNDLVQNKNYVETFINMVGNIYYSNIFEKVYDGTKKVLVDNLKKLFDLNDDEEKDIVIEFPIQIPQNPIDKYLKKEDKKENIFDIIKNYYSLRTSKMSYLYLQKEISPAVNIRKKNYQKLPDGFNIKDYKGQNLIVILYLEKDEFVLLKAN